MPFGLDDLAIASIGGSVISGVLGGNASKKAASAQEAASRAAIEEQRRQFDLTRSDTAPYREVGAASIQRLGGLTGLPGYDQVDPTATIQQTPGYQFRLDEGNNALDRFQSAGRITGGRAVKEAMRYGQDYASGEYGNYLESLFRLGGFGGNAVNTAANAGQNAASNIGQYTMAGGQATAAGQLGSASAWNNAIQGGLQNAFTLRAYNDFNSRLPTYTPNAVQPSRFTGSGPLMSLGS